MASIADSSIADPRQPGAVAFVDRWIWVFTAALFVATVLAGFVPDSLAKVAAVRAGARPPFPPILHVHAVLMGSWMTLLLAQTTLMATGRRAWHKQLGMLSLALAPAIVVAGFILAPTMYHMGWAAAQAAHGPLVHGLPKSMMLQTNIALLQLRGGLGFAICAGIAIWARRRDSGLHKRMMLLATSLPISAAIIRIAWLPTTMPADAISLALFNAALILPMFCWDLYRLGHVHRAYVIWFALFIPGTLATQLLWNSPAWFKIAPRLMGVA